MSVQCNCLPLQSCMLYRSSPTLQLVSPLYASSSPLSHTWSQGKICSLTTRVYFMCISPSLSFCELPLHLPTHTHRKLRTSDTGALLVNLCFALLGLYVAFILSAQASRIPEGLCGFFSAVLHYFMLAYFFWTAAEALFLYFKLTKVLVRANFFLRNYVYIAMATSWCKFTWKDDMHAGIY